MTDNTRLVIAGMGVTPYSARGITERLEIIDAGGTLRRTVNGALVDVTNPAFRKYRLTLSGDDLNAPAFDGIWRGQQVTVSCISELAYETGTGSTNGRTVVSGSERTAGGFTFYRPQLTMRVVDWSVQMDEWDHTVAWSLVLEEV